MNIFTRTYNRLKWLFKPARQKEKLMADAVDLLKWDPDAYALYEMAKKDGIQIEFAASLMGTTTDGYYQHAMKRIRLVPDQSGGMTQSRLAHELRHYWQYKMLGIGKDSEITRNPSLSFIFNRVIEADAYAFEKKVDAVIDNRLNGALQEIEKIKEALAQHKELEPEKAFIYRTRENYAALQKISRERMEETFVKSLAVISDTYDPREVRHLHLVHTSMIASPTHFKSVQSIPEKTVADLRRLLKCGVTSEAPAYLAKLSDGQFEELIWQDAHKGASEAVRLMDKFNAAVAANDNAQAKALKQEVTRKIKALK